MEMQIVSAILIAIVLIVIGYKIGYSFAKRNLLSHLIQKKIISSEQYVELEEEDI